MIGSKINANPLGFLSKQAGLHVASHIDVKKVTSAQTRHSDASEESDSQSAREGKDQVGALNTHSNRSYNTIAFVKRKTMTQRKMSVIQAIKKV